MKKFKCFVLFGIALLLALVSCGNSDSSNNEDTYYTITFDSMGGSPIETQKVKEGERAKRPNDPTKEGYSFDKWLNNGIPYYFVSFVKSDITLVANWEPNKNYLTITSNIEGASTITGEGMYKTNEEVVISANANPGYTFIGWYDENTELSKDSVYTFNMPTSDLCLEARFVANSNIPYTVQYCLQNANDDEYTLLELETYYGTAGNIICPPTKEYEGYITPSLITTTIKGDATTVVRYLYDRVKYELSLKNNDEIIETKKYKIGETVTLSEPRYTEIGYVFNGWYDNGSLISSDPNYTFIMPEHNVELTCDFIKDSNLELFDYNVTSTTCTITGIKDKTVTSIVVPNYVTGIEEGAFSGCGSLESIVLPFVGDKRHKSTDSNQYPLGYIFGTSSFQGGVLTRQYYYDGTNNNSYFDYCIPTSLKKISINDCEYIQFGAFSNLIYAENIMLSDRINKIQNRAFYGCSGLISIIIPSSVMDIGTSVFYGCSSLESITLPNSVASIGEEAFYGCSSLESITLPNGITSIGRSAFSGCSSLTNIKIPSSVITIGQSAFSECNSLESIILPYVGKTRYTNRFLGYIFGSDSYYNNNQHVPSSLKEVILLEGDTSIESNAFSGCSSLASVIIPSSVTSIGSSAFSGCSSLASVIISSGATSIESYAFSGCSSLASVIIPSSVTSIGYHAFSGCSSLASVIIPSSITSIDFNGCSSLTNVYYNGEIKDWCNISFVNESSNPMCYATNFYLLDSNGEIEYQENKYSLLEELIIPNSVTTIGSCQFYGFEQLKSLIIPDSVTSIGSSAFSGCSGLSSVIIPSSVTNIGYSAFSGCSSLISIIIPDSVTSIGSSAFSGCSGLASVIIPSSVTSIGNSAFSGCSNLINVYYNGTIINWLDITFESSSSNPMSCAKCFYILDNNGEEEYLQNKYLFLEELVIPEIIGTRYKIGEYHFYGFSQIKSLIIPSSIIKIDPKAFCGCDNLQRIIIKEGNQIYDSRDDCNGIVETASDKLVLGCKATIIPSSVTNIGEYAFYGCGSLTSIIIPSSVIKIGQFAFNGCNSLESITLPYIGETESTNTYLGYIFGANMYQWNFAYIPKSLKDINISYGCKRIYEFAFDGCSSLTNIKIPSSVIKIGQSAFSRCNSLESITLPYLGETRSTNRFLGYIFGSDRYYTNNQYVPSSLKEVILLEGDTNIESYAFYGCSGLASVIIPSSVTSIGYQAFYGCSGLASAIIPNSVKSIGGSAFYGCSGLASVIIPSSVTSIGYHAFSGCSGLTNIFVDKENLIFDSRDNCNGIIETSTNTLIVGCSNTIIPPDIIIGSSAFYECSSLTSIIIPSSVKSIENNAFYGCVGLTSIVILKHLTYIPPATFDKCDSLERIYYYGSYKDWKAINVQYSNDPLHNATIYYYSETEPTDEGNYWHYVDGEVTEW